MSIQSPNGSDNAATRRCGVLVADDESEILEVLAAGLRRARFSVWLAANGNEALEHFRGHTKSIDVALLDVQMPNLDGPGTLLRLRELSPHLPCCFMSGDLGGYGLEKLKELGAQAFLEKPFRISEVSRVLRGLTWSADVSAPGPLSVSADAARKTPSRGKAFASSRGAARRRNGAS